MTKTRFAPSPTGYVHVGSLRTALYCYLFAKSTNGKFVLRIEDTDQERYVEGAVENLIRTLEWANLEYDEGTLMDGSEKGDCGPYTQSLRTEIYKEHAQKLIDSGHAYRCFCTKEELDEMREKQKAQGLPPMYNGKYRDLPESEIQKKLDAGEKFVIRQKIPYELIKFKDLVRGNVQFHGKTIDDQVLVKSDGFPTYHLANVVDDHYMGITHVIRGEEWLPSTPKHIFLYKAFGWEVPEFAHLPLLLNPDGSKLSKRQGHVAVEDFIKDGYIKEALINFVAFLGWHPGSGDEREIYTLKELEESFSIEKVQKSGAVFNTEKLDWFNWRWQKQIFNNELAEIAKEIDSNVEINPLKKGQYDYKFSSEENENTFINRRGEKLLEMSKNYIPEDFQEDKEKLYKALITIEEKILRNPQETKDHLAFYYSLPNYENTLLTHEKMKVDLKQAKSSLDKCLEDLENLEEWNLNKLKNTLLETVQKLEVKNGQVFWPLRSALSGQQFSPGVFELAWVLGKEETLERTKTAIKKI